MKANKKYSMMGALVAGALALSVVAWGQATRGQPAQSGQTVQARPGASLTSHIALTPKELKWGPGPAALPKEIQAALIEGDPKVPERLFTMQLRLPAHTRIAPHFHGTDEHITVLSGELGVGMGEKFDEKALKAIPAGGFAAMPAGHRHFVQARRESVIQLHGMGPWTLTYVNPSDDPRLGTGGAGPSP